MCSACVQSIHHVPAPLEKAMPRIGFILLAGFLLQFTYSEPEDLFKMILRCYKHKGCGWTSDPDRLGLSPGPATYCGTLITELLNSVNY